MIAQQLEVEGNLREAEKHFVEAKDWKSAVQMYRQVNQWEDALRVAKVYGGVNASKQVRRCGLRPPLPHSSPPQLRVCCPACSGVWRCHMLELCTRPPAAP